MEIEYVGPILPERKFEIRYRGNPSLNEISRDVQENFALVRDSKKVSCEGPNKIGTRQFYDIKDDDNLFLEVESLKTNDHSDYFIRYFKNEDLNLFRAYLLSLIEDDY
jgi:hypothetical protein